MATTGAVSAANNTNNSSQTLSDPKLYDHNGNQISSYNSIEEAYNAAAVGTSTQMYTIELEAGGTFNLDDFEIKKNLVFTVENNGTATINGLNHRLIHVYPGFTVYFNNVIFQNGHAPDGTPLHPDGSNGGAVWNQGTLYLVNCTLRNNQAGDGGSFTYGGVGGDGGAIWNQGILTITDCKLYNNRAGHGTIGVPVTHSNGFNGGNGGAIYSTGTLNITNTELYNNHAGNGGQGVVLGDGGNGGSGGAIYSTNHMTITGTNIHNNHAGNAGAGGTEVIIGGTGGAGGNGGGIYYSGTGTATIANSQINYNIAGNGGSGASGNIGGFAGHTGGPGGSGGAIYNAGHLEITTTTIANNTAGNGGTGGTGGNAIQGLTPNTGGKGGTGGTGGHAGGIFNSHYLMITGSTVSANHSGNGGKGGAGGKGSDRWSFIITVPSGNGGNGGNGGSSGSGAGIYHSGSVLEVLSNNLTNNLLGAPGIGGTKGSKGSGNGGHDGNQGANGSNGAGGAVYVSATSQSLHFNRILGNTTPDVVAASGVSLDAENNWWGSNANPSSRVSGDVDYSPWIMLRISANPGSIHYLSNSNVTADLTWNTENGIDPYQRPSGGYVPDGVPVVFGVETGPGNVDPTDSTTHEGKSNTTYTGTGIGTARIYTQVDNQKQTIDVTVTKANTVLTVNPSTGIYKGSTTLSATLNDEYGTAIIGRGVDFYVNGSFVASGITNNNGFVSVIYSPILLNPTGSYIITAEFAGDDYYNGDDGSNHLTVGKANSTLVVGVASGTYKGSTILQAALVDQHGNIIVNADVDFYVNGSFVATGTTDGNGVAFVTYSPILLNPTGSPYTIYATFAGDDYYNGDDGSNQLTVSKANSILVTNAASGVYKGKTTLSATLVDGNGNGIAGQTITFYVNGALVGTGTTNNSGFASIIYNPINLNPAGSPYTITATFAGNSYYNASTGSNQLTVSKANTSLVVKNITGNPGQTVKITATLKDIYNKPLSGYKVTFKVNGVNIGYGYTNTSGVASKNYLVNLKGGSYAINASFAGNNYYSASNGNGMLKIPQADLYIKSWASKNNPTVGETITITFKVGNHGPDTAEKTIFTLKIPNGMSYVSMRYDQGTAIYNPTTKTVTWNLGNVVVGDPYLWLNVKVVKAGTYTIKPTLTTITYDPNLSKNIPTLTINAKEGSNNNHGKGTIGMQNTGLPVGALILAICAVLAGMVIPKRK